jgi:hypothetical protein
VLLPPASTNAVNGVDEGIEKSKSAQVLHESNLPDFRVPVHHEFAGAVTRQKPTPMPQKLLDVLLLGRCSHEFSWPRRAADGQFYQVCLLCAAEYKYDWTTMRRTERVSQETAETAASPKRRQHIRKATWVPRARRIKLDAPVRYRVKNLGTWNEGTIQNLSQSGVLLTIAQRFPENTLIEMVFEMPEEISGQKNSKVLCQGRVIRMKESKQNAETHEFAASILDYKFIH